MKTFANKVISVSGIAILYTGLLLVWFGVRLVFGEPGILMVVLNRAAVWLFVPAAGFLLFAVIRRRWGVALLQAVPAILFLALFWPYLIPRPKPDAVWPTPSEALQVMSYHVEDDTGDEKAIASTILAHKPDVICLQGVTPGMAQWLPSALKARYPWHHICGVGDNDNATATAIFSSIRPDRFYEVPLPPGRPAVFMTIDGGSGDDEGGRRHQSVSVVSAQLTPYRLRGGAITSYATHISDQTTAQHRQARRLAYEIIRKKHPVILGCDASTKDTCYTYKVLVRQLRDAARETGWRIGDSLPPGTAQDTRISRLDYLFYTPSTVVPWNVYRAKDAASGRDPLLGIFKIENTSRSLLSESSLGS